MRQKKIMELVIEEKEIDVQQMEKEKELELKKRALVLKRKDVELETYKSFAEDASSIVDAEDFNRLKSTYDGQFNFDLSAVPTGGPAMLNIIPDEDQVLSSMFETPRLDYINRSNADHLISSGNYLTTSEQALKEIKKVRDVSSQSASRPIQKMKSTSQSSVRKPLRSAEGRVPCCSGPQSFGIPGVRDQPERRHVNSEESAIEKTSPKDKFKRGVE